MLAPEEIGARERAAALAGLGWAGSLRCGAASAAHPVTKGAGFVARGRDLAAAAAAAA